MNEINNNTIKTHVPDRGISEILMRNLDRYDDASYLALMGMPNNPEDAPRNYNEKIENRFEGLKSMRAIQYHIISGNTLGTINTNAINVWNKKYKDADSKKENPFEEEDNDFNELSAILLFLSECEEVIDKSIETPSPDDDFIWKKQHHTGEIRKELTQNFKKMHKDLVDSYKSIWKILLKNKIVTLGNEEDKDVTEEEKEKEVRRRILQA